MNQQYKGESSSSSSSSSTAAAASSTSNNNNNNGNLNVFVIDSDEEPQFVDLTQEQNDYYDIDSDHSNYIDEENYEDPIDNIISSQNLSKLQHQLTLLLNQNDSNKRYGLSRNTKNYIDLDDLDFFNNNYNNSKPFQYNRNPISNSISSSIYRGSNNAILTEGQAREQLRKLLESINDDVPPPESRVGTPDGLVVNLLEHQKIGFQWMTKQEESINKGGMLTDDMGLGKTIQALSIIVSRKCQEMDEVPDVISAAMRRRAKQPEKTFKIKATLVICPVSLMEQWAQEIKTKTENISVYIHHGANRIHNIYELAKFDVIITSYNIISMEFNDNEILAGPLKKVKVHRIILDEAHTIKNRNTRAAMGCCQIEADYRWCLTATPIQNNIDELYSLIKFLQIKPYNDWNIFRDEISKKVKAGDPNVCTKIQLILKAISLRRTKKAQIDGRPILNLPERNVHFTHVEFPPEEREFYNYVNTGVMKKFDEYVRNGTVMKHYSSILVLLLRLRQACLHPSLTSIEKPEKIDDTENQEKCAMSLDSKVVDRLLSSKYELETSECPICMDAADNPQIIAQCGHIMCKECISNYMNSGGNYGGPKTCPQCRGELDPKALLSVEIFFKIHAPELHKSEEEIEVKPESLLEGLAAVQDFISSKKIDTMLEILKKTEKDTHGQDKTIVFSQFTSMLDIMEKPLKMNGIKFGRYDGSMPIGNRTKMIDAFYNDPDMKVLLVSTKCGSLGLNLTMANRVIMMDVWWNPALENQAIDRVHRIGQTKDVEVHRIFIKDTVEDRILELQRKKQELADSALGEGKTQKLGRLGMEEMLYLFHGGSAPTVAQIGQGI
ncbi:SNF2 family N-terminal domain-containing protein [Cunninghamella echinulata]|nr:SNF2 family N-terminal domain-containing protein [Cunninghamella echinulata]